jgi:hypothetical protein
MRGLISLWLYKEHNKLQDWRNVIYSTYSPLNSTHLWLRCSNFFNPSKKNYFGCAANRTSQRLISTYTYRRSWDSNIIACRSVAGQRPRGKEIYESRCWVPGQQICNCFDRSNNSELQLIKGGHKSLVKMALNFPHRKKIRAEYRVGVEAAQLVHQVRPSTQENACQEILR